MQDIKPLIDYYGESPRKNKRRFELLQSFFEHLVVNRGYNDNMSQICSAIGVERKTVYRYYNSKEDIIAEVNYYIYMKRNLELEEKIEEVLKNDNLDTIDKFVVIINLNVEVLTQYRDDMGFAEFAKRVITNLDHNTSTYSRYIYLMNVHEFVHFEKILTRLEAENKLREGITAAEYARTIEQILYSFVAQTLEYENNFNRFDNTNVSKVINLILLSTLKDYSI